MMIKGLFTDIAEVYDRMNHVLSLGLDRRWRKHAAMRVRGTPKRVLDLACGTGDLAFEFARRFRDAEVLGVDLTPSMLEIAKQKNRSRRVSFAEGDAMDLSRLGEGSFSLCSCAFGFRNFTDRRRALCEVRRALAPGGELIVLEFFHPESRALGFATSVWLRALTALFARSRSAQYRHLRESIAHMDTVGEFVSRAESEGFVLSSRSFSFPCCTCLSFTSSGAGVRGSI